MTQGVALSLPRFRKLAASVGSKSRNRLSGEPTQPDSLVEGHAMNRAMMVIAASLLVAGCGGQRSDSNTERSDVPKVMPVTDSSTMQQKYITSMERDLVNLRTAEEWYFQDHAKYTTNVESLPGLKDPVFPTPDNSMPRITLVGGGFTATIQNPNTRQVCAIFVETKTPFPPATVDGVPACQ